MRQLGRQHGALLSAAPFESVAVSGLVVVAAAAAAVPWGHARLRVVVKLQLLKWRTGAVGRFR